MLQRFGSQYLALLNVQANAIDGLDKVKALLAYYFTTSANDNLHVQDMEVIILPCRRGAEYLKCKIRDTNPWLSPRERKGNECIRDGVKYVFM